MFDVRSRTAIRNGPLIPPFPYVIYQTINMGVNYTRRQKWGFSRLVPAACRPGNFLKL